jgi:hypothetical protein
MLPQEEAAEPIRLSEQIIRRDTELHAAQTKIAAEAELAKQQAEASATSEPQAPRALRSRAGHRRRGAF